MNAGVGVLVTLALQFTFLSLFAIGGATAAVPEIHRLAVEAMGWMTDRQFSDLFAISQLSPGPNMIIVTLVGYQAAGIAGAVVATLGMCGPACMLAFAVGNTWDKFKEARWRLAVQAGMIPVSLGFIAATAFVIARAADHNAVAFALTAVTAAVGYFTRINPLWLFVAAALAGLTGLI